MNQVNTTERVRPRGTDRGGVVRIVGRGLAAIGQTLVVALAAPVLIIAVGAPVALLIKLVLVIADAF